MRMSVVLLCLLFAACAAPPPAPAPAAPADPEFINLDDSSPYPFSSAVRAGDLIFLSGQVGEVR